MEVTKFLGVIAFVLMVVKYAEPIQWLKVHYKMDMGANHKKLWKQVIQKILNCALCLGVWAGLIFYQDIYIAAIMSFASEITYRVIDKLFLTI